MTFEANVYLAEWEISLTQLRLVVFWQLTRAQYERKMCQSQS